MTRTHTYIYIFLLECTVFIIDENGKTIRDVVGPVDEGSRLSLLCESNGGEKFFYLLTCWLCYIS